MGFFSCSLKKAIIFGTMETIKINTSQHVEIDYPVAGLGERVAAYLIDFVLFAIIFLLCRMFFLLTSLEHSFENTTLVVLIIVYGVCYVFYDLLCEIAFNGQSLGKKLLKIKVVSLDGGQPSIGQYFMRWIFRIVDFTLTLHLLGFVSVAVSDKKQRIGDVVAGTTLIRTVPAAKIEQIAFHPVEGEYTPVFNSVQLLNDRDIELIHEVISTYYRTQNPQLIYQMATKVSAHLAVVIPEGMNEMQFLKTVSSDYIQLTSRAV
jgi:uncharacterized RDD family membrane protein YckC